jgi:hypothetical protein
MNNDLWGEKGKYHSYFKHLNSIAKTTKNGCQPQKPYILQIVIFNSCILWIDMLFWLMQGLKSYFDHITPSRGLGDDT